MMFHRGKHELYLVLAQEPVVFWRVLRRKLGSSAGGDSLRFLVDFLKPKMGRTPSLVLVLALVFLAQTESKSKQFVMIYMPDDMINLSSRYHNYYSHSKFHLAFR